MACWFCSVHPSEANHVLQIDMHGEVDALKVDTETQIAYHVRHIDIARCSYCHSRHRQAKAARVFAAAMAFLLIVASITIVFALIPALYSGLWAGFTAGLMLGALVAGGLLQKGIHTEHKARVSYPEVKELRDKGYHFGLHPKAKPAKKLPHQSPTGKSA